MDRRLFLTGLLGVAGAAAVAAALPRQANALTGPLPDDLAERSGALPEVAEAETARPEAEGVQVARHGGPHPGRRRRRRRRRRVRRRRFRRVCTSYRNRWGEWVRRCRRRPFFAWIWI